MPRKIVVFLIKIIILVSLIALYRCGANTKLEKDTEKIKFKFIPDFNVGKHTFVYKTRKNFNDNIPVLLSEDKTKIISYPHPLDVTVENILVIPTKLKNGYLLDNKGISKNAAFISIKYDAFSKMKNAPSYDVLYSLIIDKDPITELYDCGNKIAFDDELSQLNHMIKNNSLGTICKRIK